MCGIIAISRNPDRSSIPDARSFLRYGLHTIEQRGRDATGLAWVAEDGWPWYWKQEGRAMVVANNADLPTGITTAIGHTRHATLGKPSDNRNNHPIEAPGLLLVHNGRVENHEDIFDLIGDYRRTGRVDSEAIAAALAHPEAFGCEEPHEVLEWIEGVAAIAWMESATPELLHLARTSGRPMTIGYTRRSDFVMSSTPETLKAWSIASRVEIANVTQVRRGTYLVVEGGQIVHEARFTPHTTVSAVPDDVPTSVSALSAVSAAEADAMFRQESFYDDEIDWDSLVNRRGWA